MSPAAARFRLLRGGCGTAVRSEVLGRIRGRWGEAAVEQVRERVMSGTEEEARVWLRRSAYFVDLPSMLDLERTLPVSPLNIQGLLGLLTAADRPTLCLILLRFRALGVRDRRRAAQGAPWLEDVPDAPRALGHLFSQGWLLIGCGHREQGLALWKSLRRGRGILANRYDLGPELRVHASSISIRRM